MSEKERKKLVNKQYYIKRNLITKANKLNDMFDGVKVSLRFLVAFNKEDQIILLPKQVKKTYKVSYKLLKEEILSLGQNFVNANPNTKE